TEVAFPVLDAGSKDPAKMTIKLSPESTRSQTKAGAAVAPSSQNRQKAWLPSNFHLTIDGLDCTRVNKIEALTIKQRVSRQPAGQQRAAVELPGGMQLSNLVVTLAETSMNSWVAWQKNSAVQRGFASGKNGQLDFLAPNQRDALFTLQFSGLQLARLTAQPLSRGDSARRVRAEMLIQKVSFQSQNAAWA